MFWERIKPGSHVCTHMQICVRGNKHESIYPFICASINKANPQSTYAWLSQMFQHPKLFQAHSFRYTVSCSKFDLCALSPPCWDKESRDHCFSCFVVLQETEAFWSRRRSGSTMADGVEGVELRWDLSAEEISKRTDELIERSKRVYDAVGALKPDQLSYENCLKVL